MMPGESPDYRTAVIKAEAQRQEHDYTVGDFNRYSHAAVESNSHLERVESGHLEYVRSKGVRKTQERDCLRCYDTGLNDGRWHSLPLRETSV